MSKGDKTHSVLTTDVTDNTDIPKGQLVAGHTHLNLRNMRLERRAAFPGCRCWRLSSRQFLASGLESPSHRQARKPALRPNADSTDF